MASSQIKEEVVVGTQSSKSIAVTHKGVLMDIVDSRVPTTWPG